jgi:1-acyl-sn-glycerol-3-phosphate acyltransferase
MNIIQRAVKASVWVALRLIYRVRTNNIDRIPATGAAILTPNHVSLLDALLIAAHTPRQVHYAMYYKIYAWTKWITAPMGAFPIAGKSENPAIYEAAFNHIAACLDKGDLVCIFPEGKITTTGEMDDLRSGILKIHSRNQVPVIPVGLKGLWGSYFSYKKKGLFKLPDHFMAKIEMNVGQPHDTVVLEDLSSDIKQLIA